MKTLFLSALVSLSLNSILAQQSVAAITIDRVAAVVVDEPILQSEVLQLKASIESNPSVAAAYRLEAGKLGFDAILDRMIEEKVVKVVVKELDIQVADSEVETQINSIAKQNGITRKQLEEGVKQEGLTFDEYKKSIKGQLERRNLFDRELRRGGGITETDLRATYEKSAPVEIKASVISVKNTPAARKVADELVKDLKDKKRTFESAVSEYAGDSLGWLTVDSINSKFGKVANLGEGDVVGPTQIEGQVQILLIEGNRRGSAEGFEKAKNELTMQAQSQDFERRFQSWLEKKKTEINIVINK